VKRLEPNKTFAVAEKVKAADRHVDPKTQFVYTNGHLTIPVGYVDAEGQLHNKIPQEMYKQMGIL
jgi:hypothetical protein